MTIYERFRADMAEAGFEVREYAGRNFYRGPAVDVRASAQVQDVIRATAVRLISDNMGCGVIVYPAITPDREE